MKAELLKLIEDGVLTPREADKLEGSKSIKEVDLTTMHKLIVLGSVNEDAHRVVNGFEDISTVFESDNEFHEFEDLVRDSQNRTVGDLLDANKKIYTAPVLEEEADDEVSMVSYDDDDDEIPYNDKMQIFRISSILSMINKEDAETILRAIEGVNETEEIKAASYHTNRPSAVFKKLLLKEGINDLGLLYLAYKLEEAEKSLGLAR